MRRSGTTAGTAGTVGLAGVAGVAGLVLGVGLAGCSEGTVDEPRTTFPVTGYGAKRTRSGGLERGERA